MFNLDLKKIEVSPVEEENKKNISRRDFFKKAGTLALAGVASSAERVLASEKKEKNGEEETRKEDLRREELNNFADILNALQEEVSIMEKGTSDVFYFNYRFVIDFLKKNRKKFPLLIERVEKSIGKIENCLLNEDLAKELVRVFAGEGYFLNLNLGSQPKKLGKGDFLIKGEIKEGLIGDYPGLMEFFGLKEGQKKLEYLSISDKEIRPMGFNQSGVQFINQAGMLKSYRKFRRMAKSSPAWNNFSLEDCRKSLRTNEFSHKLVRELYPLPFKNKTTYEFSRGIVLEIAQIDEFFSDVSEIGTEKRGSFRVISNALSSLMIEKEGENSKFGIKKEGNWYYFTSEVMLSLLVDVFQKKPEGKKYLIGKLKEIMDFSNKSIENPSFSIDLQDDEMLDKIEKRAKKDLELSVSKELEFKKDEIKKDIFERITDDDLDFIRKRYMEIGKRILVNFDKYRVREDN